MAEALADLAAAQAALDAYRRGEREAEEMQARMAAITEQIAALEAERAQVGDAHYTLLTALDEAEPGLADLAALTAGLADLEQQNARARAAARRTEVYAEHAAAASRSEAMSRDIACLDETKRTLLAEAVMPLPGLSFADDGGGLTYEGVPLEQCCSSERLKVAVAVAMAARPRLRVIRVTDGSLLDSASMRTLEALAVEHGAQVWVEVVDETGQVGVVIEDGAVASTDTTEVAR